MAQTPDLSRADAYRQPEIRAAAEAVARLQCAAFGLGEAQMLDRILAGQYPRMVKAYLQAESSRAVVAYQCRAMLKQPGAWRGRRIEVLDHVGEILVHGPYDADLGREVLRAGGHWCGQNLRNRRCFVVPLPAMESLLRGLQRWKVIAGDRNDAQSNLRGTRDGDFRVSR